MPADRKRPEGEAGPSSWTSSIRVRLMLVAAIAVLPLLINRGLDIETDRRERIDAASQQALTLAKQGMAAQNEAIVSARAFLDVVASAQALLTTRGDRCDKLLEDVAAKAPWLKSISIVALDGKIFCSSNVNAVGINISKHSHFVKAMQTGEFALSDYSVGPLSGPALFIALPSRLPNGSVDAIVAGVLELSWFGRVAGALAQSSGSVVLMIDGKGTVLAREPHGVNWLGRQFKDHPMVDAVLATSEGTYTGPSLDGVRRIFGFVQLPGTSARLAVGFDESDVLRRVTRESVTAFTGLGVLTVLVLIAIWFGGQRLFVEPIRLLTRTAQQFGRGEFKARAATLPWATEFVPLAVALDDMAGQLAAREQNLLDSNGQLQELVNVDGLTGIANRRSFNARLADEWRRGAKLDEPIALLMIDVDHFKAFNDRYGHAQGDVCLRNVSHALTSKARMQLDAREGAPDATMPPSFRRFADREPDFVARYGGEEFVVLMQGATADNALKVAERLRRAVEEAHVIHESAPRGFVTISIGVASVVPEAAKSPHELIDAADAALYEAKRRGRNRVVAQPAATLREVG